MEQDIMVVTHRSIDFAEVYGALLNNQMKVTQFKSIEAAEARLSMYSPAFVLLDYSIKGINSFLQKLTCSICLSHPYVIVVGSCPNTADRAAMLRLGADACISCPIDADEVIAIIQAVQRRESWITRFNHNECPHPIVYKDLAIDTLERHVTMQGKSVDLTTKEYDILHLLAQNRGSVLTKSEIYQTVWNTTFSLDASVVMNHISSIRKKLGLKCKNSDYIRTVFGIGYCLGWLDDE